MNTFMEKYNIVLTSLLGVAGVIWLIAGWNDLETLQKLPLFYIIALSIHVIEEMKLPGGFVELVTGLTGLRVKKMGIAKLGLMMFLLYATLIPICISRFVWPVMSTLMIGVLEFVAHLVSARVNPRRFYSPGMLTAILVQFPVSVYGFYHLISHQMIQPHFWVFALLFLFVPLFSLQAIIVKASGQSYVQFVTSARKALLTKNGREAAQKRMK